MRFRISFLALSWSLFLRFYDWYFLIYALRFRNTANHKGSVVIQCSCFCRTAINTVRHVLRPFCPSAWLTSNTVLLKYGDAASLCVPAGWQHLVLPCPCKGGGYVHLSICPVCLLFFCLHTSIFAQKVRSSLEEQNRKFILSYQCWLV